MAGYGYTYKGGYPIYNPPTERWSKSSYTSDHSCQPVIIDAEGRRKPIISYTPNGSTEYYVTKTEVVEHVPLITGYKQSTPVRFEVVTDYGDRVEEKWNRPSSPEKWRRTSSPVRYHVEEKWKRPSSPVHDRPQQVEDFITKVQTEASRPDRKFGPMNATYWRQSNPYANTGYGHDESDLGHKEWQKPSGNTIRKENHDGSYKTDNFLEPTVITSGTWAKPNHGAWSTTQGANLSKATSDINSAVDYLKEATKPSAGVTPPYPRYAASDVSTKPMRDSYPETIDSKEASRRYGNSGFAYTRPMDNYTTTINSREAARKYGGTTV